MRASEFLSFDPRDECVSARSWQRYRKVCGKLHPLIIAKLDPWRPANLELPFDLENRHAVFSSKFDFAVVLLIRLIPRNTEGGRDGNPMLNGKWRIDRNEDKLAAHGLSALRVDQLLGNDHLVVPNRGERRGQFLVIGTDNGGACICVVIEETRLPDIWRPVTGWSCKDSERARLEQAKGTRNGREEE